MRHTLRFALLLALLAGGCIGGANALQTTSDGGLPDARDPDTDAGAALPACVMPNATLDYQIGLPPHILGWSVVAHGAVEYQSSTTLDVEDPIDVDATLTAVDTVGSSIELTTTDGVIDVAMSPIPSEWLGALPLGAAVAARFENGIELRRAGGTLLLALVGARGTVSSPSFDVGDVHVSGGAARCANITSNGSSCFWGSTATDTVFTLGDASATAGLDGSAVSLATNGRAYRASVIGTVRQASDEEVFAVVGEHPCAPAFATGTVVAIGPDPDALLSCDASDGRISPTPGYLPTFPGWQVTVGANDPAQTSTDTILTAVDVTSSSITLSTPTGTFNVSLAPIDPAWLGRLPVGRAVHADFGTTSGDGLVLRDASDDTLLLALAPRTSDDTRHATFDIAPVHVTEGAGRCLGLVAAPPGCSIGGTAIDAIVSLGASSETIRAHGPAAMLVDGTRHYDVALVGSIRTSTSEELAAVGIDSVCAPSLMAGAVVAIGLGAP